MVKLRDKNMTLVVLGDGSYVFTSDLPSMIKLRDDPNIPADNVLRSLIFEFDETVAKFIVKTSVVANNCKIEKEII